MKQLAPPQLMPSSQQRDYPCVSFDTLGAPIPISPALVSNYRPLGCTFGMWNNPFEPLLAITPPFLLEGGFVNDEITPSPLVCTSTVFDGEETSNRIQEQMPLLEPKPIKTERRKMCEFDGCTNQSRSGGKCKKHGGSKRCSVQDCTKNVQSRGFCIRHGGGTRCKFDQCARASQSLGLCKVHGGGRCCVVEGCTKKAHLQRRCRQHGGGFRCSVDGCPKWAQRKGTCLSHANQPTPQDVDGVVDLERPHAMSVKPIGTLNNHEHRDSRINETPLNQTKSTLKLLQHPPNMPSDAQVILKILNKRPEVRSMEEVDSLFEWILKNGSTNKLFSGIQDVICKTICREMTLFTATPNSVICYQGDFGDVFYIIITGQVGLYVEETTENKKQPFEEDMKRMIEKAMAEGVHTTSHPRQFGTFIRHIGAGGTFGELAVMEPTAQRTCTVVSTQLTSFICLKRTAYQRLVRANNGDQIGFTQFEFIEDLYFFEEWNHNEVQCLSSKLRQVSVSADSFLQRHGNESNSMYFIYAGIVQESLPMVCLMDENGIAIKYSPVEEKSKKSKQVSTPLPVNDHAVQGISLSELKRKRVNLEIALYEEHDVCGEHSIVLNATHSKVDLRAVTDVKALVMDKATWTELFLAEGTDSILNALALFKQLAQARDNWRDTRAAIAVSHPRLLLTLSTRAMMRIAKIICGWCGSTEHNTGDSHCSKVITARRKAEIRKKKKIHSDKHRQQLALERRRVLNTKSSRQIPEPLSLKFRFRIAARAIVSTVQINNASALLLSPHQQILKDWQVAANNQTRICKDKDIEPKLQVPEEVRLKADAELRPPTKPLPKKKPIRGSYVPQAEEEEEPQVSVDPLPLSMQNSFAKDNLTSEYRRHMMASIKKFGNTESYQEKRAQVVERMVSTEVEDQQLPRRPRVPKNRPKRKGPQTARVYRRVDRMLKKLWPADHTLPEIEESLRDIHIN